MRSTGSILNKIYKELDCEPNSNTVLYDEGMDRYFVRSIL